MKLNELRPTSGARKKRKRRGRGVGSGHGGTSTRGHKGQKARSGGYHKVGFEGGQMPLQRRLPKRGFNNIFRVSYTAVNLDRLQDWPTDLPVSVQSLQDRGLLKKSETQVKLLGRGECALQLTVALAQVSATAKKKIEAAGGRIEVSQTTT